MCLCLCVNIYICIKSSGFQHAMTAATLCRYCCSLGLGSICPSCGLIFQLELYNRNINTTLRAVNVSLSLNHYPIPKFSRMLEIPFCTPNESAEMWSAILIFFLKQKSDMVNITGFHRADISFL